MARGVVLVVGPVPPPYNGQSVATAIMVDELRRSGVEVRHINLASMGRTGQSGKFSVIRSVELVKALRLYIRACAQSNVDVVYITVAQTRLGVLRDALFVWFARLFGLPIVGHVHGGRLGELYLSAGPPLRAVIRAVYRSMRRIIVLSNRSRDMFNGIVELDRVVAIPNPVDRDLVLSESDVALKLKRIEKCAGPLRMLYLSNLIATKGYKDVILAVQRLAASGYPVHCTLAGSFVSKEEELETFNFVREAGLEKYVEFVGVVTGAAKRQLLIDSDVYLLPTYYPNEGLPISMLEAMACGLALVVTNYRAIGEVVQDGVNGFFVPARDPGAIAEAVIRLMDPSIRRSMALANIQAVQKHYTVDHYVAGIRHALGVASDS